MNNNISIIHEFTNEQPFCGIEIWIHFGASNDPIGMSGIAHFLEHLLCSAIEEIDSYLFYNKNASTSKDRIRLGGTVGSRHATDVIKRVIDNIINLHIDDYNFNFQKQKVIYEIEHTVKSPILNYIEIFEKKAINLNTCYSKSTFGMANDIKNLDYNLIHDFWKQNLYKGITISLTGNIDIEIISNYLERKVSEKCTLQKSLISSIDTKIIVSDVMYNGVMFVYDVEHMSRLDVLYIIDYLKISLKRFPIAIKNIEYKKCRVVCVYIPDNIDYLQFYNSTMQNIDVEKQYRDIAEYRTDCLNEIKYNLAQLARYNLETIYFCERESIDIALNRIKTLSSKHLLQNLYSMLLHNKVVIISKNNKNINNELLLNKH